MPSYVVCLDETKSLLDLGLQWSRWGCGNQEAREFPIPHGGKCRPLNPLLLVGEDVFVGLVKRPEWQRIRWFYYNDNKVGISIRVYDTEHFAAQSRNDRYGQYYIEEDRHRSRNHYDRVILRGYTMGPPLPEEEGLDVNELRHEAFFARDPTHPVHQRIRDIEANGALKLKIRALSCWRIWPAKHAPSSPSNPETHQDIFHNPDDIDIRLKYFQHRSRNNMPANGS